MNFEQWLEKVNMYLAGWTEVPDCCHSRKAFNDGIDYARYANYFVDSYPLD